MTNEAVVNAPAGRVERVRRVARVAGVVLLTGVALALPRPTAAKTGSGSKAPHVWLDADGEPLPFQSHAEIEDYLRGASVVSGEEIGIGINKMDKLLVERDGVRAHAIFRTVDLEKERTQVGDRFYLRFKDHYAGECAAYAVAQLLGLDNVPPAVLRTLDDRRGSMQIWVENARDQSDDDFRPPSAMQWVQQTWDMLFFDSLIRNVDRNSGNVLAGDHYRLWLIDHTRAFEPQAELLDPQKVQRFSRAEWTRLVAISDDELADATREFLDAGEISALLERRKLMVEHVQKLIDELGAGIVLH